MTQKENEEKTILDRIEKKQREQSEIYKKLDSGNFWDELSKLSQKELFCLVNALIDHITISFGWDELDGPECEGKQQKYILESLKFTGSISFSVGGTDNE